MSLESSGIAARMYAALANREFDVAAECTSPDVTVLNIATGDVYIGRPGFLEYVRSWTVAFPDLRFNELVVSGSEDRFVAEYELKGTHTGPFVTPRGHIPPTGMEIQAEFCDVLMLNHRLIGEVRSYFDSVTVLRQLGLVAGSPLHAPDRRAALDLYAQPVDTNAPQRNKAIVQRFLQDVYNRQRPAAADDTCSSNHVWHGGGLGETQGLTSYQKILTALFTALPDLEVGVLDSVAEGDRVMVRYSLCGTHLGQFQGIGPSFKRIAGGGTNTYRLEENRIAEEWWQGDLHSIVQQLDAAPTSPRSTS